MNRLRPAVVAGLAVLAGLAGAGPARAEPRVIAQPSSSSPVSAYGDVVAFSDGPRPAGPYELMIAVGDAPPVAAAIPARAVPFDVDLGPDRDGRPVAVYSRCRREPTEGGQLAVPRVYAHGRGCDLYRYDIAARRERRVTFGTSATRSEVLPSIWRDRIAYVGTGAGLRGRQRGARVFLRALAAGARERPLPTGTPPPRGFDHALRAPVDLDLRGRAVAYVWDVSAGECPGPSSGVDFEYDPVRSELWLGDVGGSARRVEAGCSTSESIALDSLTLAGGELSFLRLRHDGLVAETRRLADGRRVVRPVSDCTSALSASTGAFILTRFVPCPDPSVGQPPAHVEIVREPRVP